MGLDVRVFRNEKQLEEILKSERARGKGEQSCKNVVALDQRWRESKTKLDELNCTIRRFKDLVKNEKVSNAAKELGLKLKELMGLQRVLKADERAADKLLKEQLKDIGNLISSNELNNDLAYHSYNPLLKPTVPQDSFILGPALIEKQKLVSVILQHFSQHSFESFHSPSFLKNRLLSKVFPNKPFLKLNTSTPLSLITNPLQSLLLMHYKTKLSLKRFISYGVCFNYLQHQAEKISLIMFTELSEEQDCFQECLRWCEEFFKKIGLEVSVQSKPVRRLGLWYKVQYDFFCWTNSQFVRIASCANSGDYLSRSAKIKLIDNSIPSVISIKFRDLRAFLQCAPF